MINGTVNMYDIFYTRKENSLWTLHDIFNELSLFLQEYHNGKINAKLGGHTYINIFDYNIGDCEIAIYNQSKDILKIISFSETKTDIIDILKNRNNPNDLLIILHNLSWGHHLTDINNYKFKLKNTTFYPFSPKINYNFYYNLRQLKNYDHLIDKMFLRTTTGRGDEYRLSEMGLINELFPPITCEKYLEKAISYKAGLSIPTATYEICHRDFDYMAIGLPLIRLELIGNYYPKLVPNYHYISIDRTHLSIDNYKALVGGDEYVKAYKDKFYEIKDNINLLKFISKNAFEYYNTYCSPQNRLKHLLNLLEI